MNLSDESVQLIEEYSYITKSAGFLKLLSSPRHRFTNTYDHSVRVAVVASRLARLLGADHISAVRAALLHDYCFEDHFKPNGKRAKIYLLTHPLEAADNAVQFNISEQERNAIVSHMFPLCYEVPKSRIAFSITAADKVVAAYEGMYGFAYSLRMLRMFRRRAVVAVKAKSISTTDYK